MVYAAAVAKLLRGYADELTNEDVQEVLSRVDLSELSKYMQMLGPPYSPMEVKILVAAAGNNMDDDTDFERDGDLWRDDILEKYAKFVHNYEYQYNDEALNVDGGIDTDEVHIGPMAQDLEKVNPATVKEDESGYKVVDTGRLALMNAGAIADLAREVKELKGG